MHDVAKPIASVIISRARLGMRVFAGKLFNWTGVPGLVREAEYRSTIDRCTVQVQVGRLFTVISVNGLDIYFHRLTGKIDGIGFTPRCSTGPARESGHPLEPAE